MIKKYYLLLAVLALCPVFWNCGSSAATEKIYELIQAEIAKEDPAAGLNGLISLDQKYDSPLTKLYLSVFYNEIGDYQRSAVYFNEIDDVEVFNSELEQVYHIQQARININNDDLESAVRSFGAAVEAGAVLTNNEKLVLAICHMDQGNISSAAELYDSVWKTSPGEFSTADLDLYCKAMIELGNDLEALRVLDEAELFFGYFPGIGTYQSAVYRRLGNPYSSLSAACKEIEYQSVMGTLKDAAAEAAGLLVLYPENEELFLLVSAFTAYSSGRYDEAAALFIEIDKVENDDYLDFLVISSRVLGDEEYETDVAEISELALLENRYRTNPVYYYSLWRAMKQGPGEYGFQIIRPLIEKSILLNPEHPAASAGRIEICRLLELEMDPADFSLPEEILYLLDQSLKTDSDEFSGRLSAMLSAEPNLYSDSLLVALADIAADGPGISQLIGKYEHKLSDDAVSRLKRSGLI